MSQKDLARQLGVAESTLSAWAKAGAPVAAGADAVRRWRNHNRRPYVPSAPTPAARAAAAVAGASAGPTDELAATIDELETQLLQTAVMTTGEALAMLAALAAAGAARLTAGQPLGDLEPPIRAALRAIPMDRRAEVAIPVTVFDALCAEVISAVERSLGGPDAMAQERQRYEAGGAAEAERMGEFWYSIACGELTLDPEKAGAQP